MTSPSNSAVGMLALASPASFPPHSGFCISVFLWDHLSPNPCLQGTSTLHTAGPKTGQSVECIPLTTVIGSGMAI